VNILNLSESRCHMGEEYLSFLGEPLQCETADFCPFYPGWKGLETILFKHIR